jgi:hypothetical protein
MSFDVVSYIGSLHDDVEVIVIENEGIEYLPDLSRFTPFNISNADYL